jgi:hypothetical protein
MAKKSFLFNFREKADIVELSINPEDDEFFCEDSQISKTAGGEASWASRSRRRPTSCFTAGRTIKAGYTRSGKYKPAKYMPSKSDKRAGK